MITELAEATSQVFKWVNSLGNETTQQRIDSTKKEALTDCEAFKDAVLAGNTVRVNAMLGGLQHGFRISLDDSEIIQLQQITPALDGSTLLSLFARARFADFAADVAEIINTAKTIGV